MQDTEMFNEDLIDLGSVKEGTKGAVWGILEQQQSLYWEFGISED